MSTSPMFRVEFVIKKAGGQRGDRHVALVAAADQHPKSLLAVLANNFTLGSGESFDIVSVGNEVAGTEGAVILT